MTDLESIARAATPGPWRVFGQYIRLDDGKWIGMASARNRRHIAEWSPERALAALACVDKLRELCDEMAKVSPVHCKELAAFDALTPGDV